jgi:predicted amidohydrolase YtcJ
MRDANGEPTGWFKEAASRLVSSKIPAKTEADNLEALRAGLKYAGELGITRVHSAGGDDPYLPLLAQLKKKGELTLRFYLAPFMTAPKVTIEEVHKLEALREKYRDDFLNVSAAKFVLDGVIESHTA